MKDKAIERLISKEGQRQKNNINLIASENFVSEDVLQALGSIFTNKYAEGYSKERYYTGNKFVDELEVMVQARALELFNISSDDWSVNIQPYSGSPANLAVYHALIPLGGKIMGMSLNMGGHLTHGHKASLTGKLWKQVAYGVDEKTERIDYEALKQLAEKEKPKLIIAGYSAYSREVDFKKFREIADEVGALLMADISHIAGLIAGGVHQSPFPHAGIVTTTTHKTLRGPRSAIIFSRKDFSKAIDKAVFPGLQGGPHVNQIAAVGVALHEASAPSFKEYSEQVIKNAQTLAENLQKLGWRVISGGTDTHLFLINVYEKGLGGEAAGKKLENAGIIVNKNGIPYDTKTPRDPSGIRLGTPAVTTRGMGEKEMKLIAEFINNTLLDKEPTVLTAKKVVELCNKFPIY